MQPSNSFNLPDVLQKSLLVSIVLGLALVTLGWILAPATNPVTAAGAYGILIVYGLLGGLGVPIIQRKNPRILRLAAPLGLLAGAVFAIEILLEYVLLPADNTLWGVVEFGVVFGLYFISGLVAAYRDRRIRPALGAAMVCSMIASLLWLIAVLGIFYLFRGTPQQARVFQSEGNYADFVRSGMNNFDAFIMEDLFGAAFFHLLLSPILAVFLGALGGLAGQAWALIARK